MNDAYYLGWTSPADGPDFSTLKVQRGGAVNYGAPIELLLRIDGDHGPHTRRRLVARMVADVTGAVPGLSLVRQVSAAFPFACRLTTDDLDHVIAQRELFGGA